PSQLTPQVSPGSARSLSQVASLPSAQPSSKIDNGKPAARKPEANAAAVVKYRLAESLLKQNDQTGAIEALNVATQLQPNFIEAHFALAVILALQGKEKYGEAVDCFLTVLQLDPKHVDARINLSNVLEKEGDFEGAASALKEALSIAGERADLYVMLGKKQAGAERYSDSIKSF